ncbi:MAG: tRNA 4-thiouridine(8) synthase ThiI [Candidatus Methanomethylophilus sp.]|nr:tRNA 4-thiouridine(8) synthase ThiI [Methanomethylophilus sp.]MDD4668252.1 tRNA 4-thiouridine(8) synthase ThiI [Methanomethylophilus sp.]
MPSEGSSTDSRDHGDIKFISLISGGIDSPVASYLMTQMGTEVILLHMDNRPFADDLTIARVKKLAVRLRKVTGQEMPLYSAPHGVSQGIIAEHCDHNYQCVMCKRAMQRTAKLLGLRLGCSGIIMGDSLGQVASQTLRNIRSENLGLEYPVIRPLIGYDKLEIEAIAKRIGTFDLSIEPVIGCTAVPLRPVTEADPERVRGFDQAVQLQAIVETAASNVVRLS